MTSKGGEISGSLRQVVREVDRGRVWGRDGVAAGMVLGRFGGRISCDREEAIPVVRD